MPSRNVDKIYISDQYYHVYNNAIGGQRMFLDDDDYAMFIAILKRYLTGTAKDARGRTYESLRGRVELLAFCLLPDSYHLLVYIADPTALTDLLRKVGTTYTMYFNKRYAGQNRLAQKRFRAARVDEECLADVLRFIHLQPVSHRTWDYSSHPYYAEQEHEDWIQTSRLLKLLGGQAEYIAFANDHNANKLRFESYKDQLANF